MDANEEQTSQSKSSAPAISQMSGGSTAQPSSGPVLLTPEQADAQLGTHSVKIYIKLQDDGCNIRPWMKMVRDTAAIRRCQMALQQEYPDTAVDAVTGAQRNRDWERLERSGRWQQRLLAGNQSELQTGESLDIRSVNLFIGIESREEPRDQK